MQIFSSNIDGVTAGEEHASPLFIRKVTFPTVYSESSDHQHPNSFEYYIIINGELVFVSGDKEFTARSGDIVYFQEGELHRISSVKTKTEMLLFKKIGAIKQ